MRHYLDIPPTDDNCRSLFSQTWSKYPKIKTLTEALYGQVMVMSGKTAIGHKKTVKRELRILLLDLYVAYTERKWISYGRHSSNFGPLANKKRLSKQFTKVTIIQRIDALEKLGLIKHLIGYANQKSTGNYAGKNVRSKMRATQKLIDLFNGNTFEKATFYTIDYETIDDKYFEPVVINDVVTLKDPNKDIISLNEFFKQNKQRLTQQQITHIRSTFKSYAPDILKYNELIRKTHIDCITYKYEHSGKSKETVYLAEKDSYRVFNNLGIGGNVFGGGRLVGNWWTRCKRELRTRIFINLFQTVELDFQGIHLRFAMWDKMTDYHKHFSIDDDPYSIPDADPKYRPLFKKLVLTGFNASSRADCLSSIRYEMKFNPEDFPGMDYTWFDDLDTILDKFLLKYHMIEDLFFTGVGIKYMYWDSQLSMMITNEYTSKNIATLCIFDSFMIDQRLESDLRFDMEKFWNELFHKLVPNTNYDSIPIITKKGSFKFKPYKQDPLFISELNTLHTRYKQFQSDFKQNTVITVKVKSIEEIFSYNNINYPYILIPYK